MPLISHPFDRDPHLSKNTYSPLKQTGVFPLSQPPQGPAIHYNMADAANYLQYHCHKLARDGGWWEPGEHTGVTPENNPYVIVTKLMLTVSELAEGMEAYRKDLADDKLPHRKGIEVELADAAIRIFDIAGALGLDIGGAMTEKTLYNQTRPDHQPETRKAPNGKRF